MIPGPAKDKDQGVHWDVKEGIGAGPILVKNYSVINNNVENFGDGMINVRHPRSAICITKFNQLLLVAIDGRYDLSEGLYMQ